MARLGAPCSIGLTDSELARKSKSLAHKDNKQFLFRNNYTLNSGYLTGAREFYLRPRVALSPVQQGGGFFWPGAGLDKRERLNDRRVTVAVRGRRRGEMTAVNPLPNSRGTS